MIHHEDRQPKLVTSEDYDARVFRMAKALQRGFNKEGFAPCWTQISDAALKLIRGAYTYKGQK